VIEAAGWHLDVISFNCYDSEPTAALDAYTTAGKPCLISEFSFRGADSGLPNTDGAGPKVATQAERAASFRRYVTRALHCRALVGYHWFEHADQPAEGRFDGENSNFGTVTIEDRVYDELTRAMAAVNAEAEAMHSRGSKTKIVFNGADSGTGLGSDLQVFPILGPVQISRGTKYLRSCTHK